MKALTLAAFQQQAVDNVLEIFRYAESQLRAAPDAQSRRLATAYNGAVLLEAPTGAGKTMMAGTLAERFSDGGHGDNAATVWFWFTPFAGLVAQSEGALRAQFPGLRVRSVEHDRFAADARSGDIFVTTWAAVATSRSETRRVRKSGDAGPSLDEFIEALRADGLRIGVAVDEAHHGFTRATEAVRFYVETLRPDFTLLVTATPDDRDVQRFKKAAGIEELHRVSVSRKDAVDAGLIKDGVKCVAYLAPEDQRELVDFETTAIDDAWQMHGAIKAELRRLGASLAPLMLVQVGNSDRAIADARTRLAAVGVPEEKIAWYTAADPNDDLLAVARDEDKEVLIFKLAVALGFDAPRAFTLVSLRSSSDADFGLQVVGRILRVHQRLQARARAQTLPALLRDGYVFLADAANQVGLTAAGERINAIDTELAQVSPHALVVSVAGERQVQVLRNGQTYLLPRPDLPPAPTAPAADGASAEAPTEATGLLSGLILAHSRAGGADTPERRAAREALGMGECEYPLRDAVVRRLQTERLPLSTDDLLRCIEQRIDINDTVFTAGLRRSVQIVRRETDIFDAAAEAQDSTIQAPISDEEAAERAQSVLFDAQYLDPRDTFDALMRRLDSEFVRRGIDGDDKARERALNLILTSFPALLRKAARQCCAQFKETHDAQALPASLRAAASLPRSARNGYGVMPQDLNSHEREFAQMLDADVSGTVEYWLRNEPHKPWAVGIVMPAGDRYFPDFVVKVRDRPRAEGLMLVEIKGNHILESDDTKAKLAAEHRVYGTPLMLVREDAGRFMTVRYDERKDKTFKDQLFRVEGLLGY